MTLDGKALVAIVRREPGFERIVEALAEDENPRVTATALAEAAIILTARGEDMAEIVVQTVVDRFRLTVAPFTKEHWKGAVREYEKRLKSGGAARPAFGQCLSAAVAAKLGAPLVE
jgi:uncharacterized protein with PIN domain